MRLLLTVLLILMSASGLAAELGRVEVPVPDRSEKAREAAMTAGLEQVLVRLTGSAVPTRFDGVDAMLRQPSRWARQFSYAEVQVPADAAEEPAEDQSGLTLAVDFDTDALNARLEALGAPVWSIQRPGVLLWAVLQRPAYGELLSSRSEDQVAKALQEQALARGLPLVLPEMDSTDLAQISPADVRGRFDRVINRASSRYEAPVRVTAILYTGDPVQVRWRVLDGDPATETGEFVAASEDQAVAGLVDAITGVMVQRYAVAGGVATARSLRIDGVESLAVWQDTQRYLGALAGVRDVQMKAVDGDSVFFEIMFSGAATQLQQLVELNPRLRRCDGPQPLSADQGADDAAPQDALPAPPVLHYCWQERP